MRATLDDVCKRAQVSTATVSRVINQSPLVTERTRVRVMEAMHELGYTPSFAARTLARQRTELIGVVFPAIASGFFTEVLRGIDEVAAERRYHLMTVFSHGREDEQKLIARLLLERRVDALILMNLLLPDDFVRGLSNHGVPVVLIDRPVENANLASVVIDNFAGAASAMAHLFQHGYQKIAVIGGPGDSYDALRRLAGCQHAVREAGRSLPAELVWRGGFDEETGAAATRKWIESGRDLPDAIFALNDAMALGALGVLTERGIRVPRDIALVGFDDTESARHVGLTTVRVPMLEMGRAAAEFAVAGILNQKSQRRRVLATELMVRRSCGCNQKGNQQ